MNGKKACGKINEELGGIWVRNLLIGWVNDLDGIIITNECVVWLGLSKLLMVISRNS